MSWSLNGLKSLLSDQIVVLHKEQDARSFRLTQILQEKGFQNKILQLFNLMAIDAQKISLTYRGKLYFLFFCARSLFKI